MKYSTQLLLLAVLLITGGLGLVAALLLSRSGPTIDRHFEVGRIIAAIAGNVAVSGLVTLGVLTALAAREQRLTKNDSRATGLAAARQDLKSGFETAQLARFRLSASPTASTFIEQLPQIFEARGKLQRVQRERYVAEESTVVVDAVQAMLDDLSRLLAEYRRFAYLRAQQLREESNAEAVKRGQAELAMLDLARMPRFPELARFLDERAYAASGLWRGYFEAKGWLEAQARR